MHIAIGTRTSQIGHLAAIHFLPVAGAALVGAVIGMAIPLDGDPTASVHRSSPFDAPSSREAMRLPLTVYYLVSDDEHRDQLLAGEHWAAGEPDASIVEPATSVKVLLVATPGEEVSARQQIDQDIRELPDNEVNYRVIDLRGQN